MLALDARDAGDIRESHVGGIEPASKSRFQDRPVDAGVSEDQERRRAQHVEEARRERGALARLPFDVGTDALDDTIE